MTGERRGRLIMAPKDTFAGGRPGDAESGPGKARGAPWGPNHGPKGHGERRGRRSRARKDTGSAVGAESGPKQHGGNFGERRRRAGNE